jgi:hypothetical protein
MRCGFPPIAIVCTKAFVIEQLFPGLLICENSMQNINRFMQFIAASIKLSIGFVSIQISETNKNTVFQQKPAQSRKLPDNNPSRLLSGHLNYRLSTAVST